MKRLSLGARFAVAVVPMGGIAVGLLAYLAWTAITGSDPLREMTSDQVLIVALVAGFLVVVGMLATVMLGRGVVARVNRVSEAAKHVVDIDVTRLIEVIKEPGKESRHSSTYQPLATGSGDILAELGASMNQMHEGLVDATQQQMAILSKGISEIFVTLARRNSSLVHRQLSLLDELEAKEEDPEVLGGYYRIDHLATRMKRNSESLLVLAGSEAPRTWSEPTEMSEVIRAAVGEVDDYQRVEVLALEPARLVGSAVSDMAHLLSELLDNATQFSPPTAPVRVAGLFDPHGYMLTITDSGIGMSNARFAELNAVLQRPPVLGLALEPTLGMYVVARLAARHGIRVQLVPGVPGTTVRIHVPSRLLETGNGELETSQRPPSRVVAERVEPTWEDEPEWDTEPVRETHPEHEDVDVFAQAETQASPIPFNGAKPVREKKDLPVLKPVTGGLGEDAKPPSDLPALKPVFVEPEPEDAVDLFKSARPTVLPDRRAADAEVEEDDVPKPLPVRTPGASYHTEEPTGSSTDKSDGAIGIRSALGKFEKGRSAAQDYREEVDGDREDES